MTSVYRGSEGETDKRDLVFEACLFVERKKSTYRKPWRSLLAGVVARSYMTPCAILSRVSERWISADGKKKDN